MAVMDPGDDRKGHGMERKGVGRMIEMKGKVIFRLLFLLTALAGCTLLTGCGGGPIEGGGRYRALRSETLDLYLELHPLRGSRLGCGATDSLLFTYSAEEISASIKKLSDLEDDLKTLTSSGLDTRRIEDSLLLLGWIRGERYALEELLYFRYNPLLYCWILEEALWSVPLRTTPPYEGELEAYEKRRLRIPALLENAAKNMTNPPGPHMELASERIRRLIEMMPALESAIHERYERRSDLPDSVAGSITGFLGFIEGTLASQTRANMILGTENIAKIFRYGEMMELDPFGMIKEADKQTRRLRSELSALRNEEAKNRRRPETDLGRVLEIIGELDAASGGPTGIALARERVVRSEPPKNVNLGIPVLDAKPVMLSTASTFSTHPCSQSLLYIDGTPPEQLLYRTIEALSARHEARRLCAEGDSVRTLLGSDLYAHVIRFLEIDRLIEAFAPDRLRLEILLTREKIRALARMSVFFELHAGTMTTEAAIDFLRDAAEISAEEASREVMAATYAPAAAYEGIALLYIERMIKKSAERRDSKPPRERVLRILREHRYLSPAAALEYVNP